MFTINQTSGVASCCSKEPEPVTSIKNYLCKMAKCACDLPCPHVAATKVVEVSQGSFCKGTVLKTASYTIDTGGGGGGCCGGSSCSGCGGCCGKKCCGGNNTSPSNPCQPAASGCSGANCRQPGTSAARGGVDKEGNPIIGKNSGYGTDTSGGYNGGTDPNYGDTVTPGIGSTNSQTGGAYDRQDETETADVINFAVEHAIEGVKIAEEGFRWYQDPVYEASKLLSEDPTSPRANPTTPVPATVEDLLNSSYPGQVDNKVALAFDFRRSMCDRRPFPECEACMWARQQIRVTETDLYDLLFGIKTGLDAIAKGHCSWGECMFNCPGQIAAMLRQSLGPLGEIIGPAAAGAMIGMTAVHGALSSYDHLARTFANSPFRVDLLGSIGDALRSGGCPGSYHKAMNNILADLHLPASTLFTGSAMRSLGNSSRTSNPRGCPSVCTNPNVYPASGFIPGGLTGGGCGGLIDVRQLETNSPREEINPLAPRIPSEAATTRAEAVQGQVGRLMDAADEALDNILASRDLISASTPPPGTAPDDNNVKRSFDRDPYGASPSVAPYPKPIADIKLVVSTDPRAMPGVPYYVYRTNVDGTKVAVQIKPAPTPGSSLDPYRSKYGEIYVPESTTLASTVMGGTSDGGTDMRVPGCEPSGVPSSGGKGTLNDGIGPDPLSAVGLPSLNNPGGPQIGLPSEDIDTGRSGTGGPTEYAGPDRGKGSVSVATHGVTIGTSSPSDMVELDYTSIPQGPDIHPGLGSLGKSIGEAMANIPRDRNANPRFDAGSPTVTKPPAVDLSSGDEVPHELVRHPFDLVRPDYKYYVRGADGGYTGPVDISEHVGEYIESLEEAYDGREVYVSVPMLRDRNPLPANGPLIFANGLMLERVVPAGAAALSKCVETANLVTVTHIPASSMAQLYGIGLTVEEIKVAYALDHDNNGSTMPADCHAVRIPTILDTLPDDEYD